MTVDETSAETLESRFPHKRARNNKRFIGPCPACGYDRYDHAQFLYRRGLNIEEVAKLMHICPTTVKTYLAGIPSNGTEVKKNGTKNPLAEEIQRLYLSGFRKIEICEKLDLSYQVVGYNTNHLEPQKVKDQRKRQETMDADEFLVMKQEKAMEEDEYMIGKPDTVPFKKPQTQKPGPGVLPVQRNPQSYAREQPSKQYANGEYDDEPFLKQEPEVDVLKVDKNIPMPEQSPNVRGLVSYFPVNDLGIGDSFLVYNGFMNVADPKALKSKVQTAMGNYRKNHGGRFVIRLTNKGVRVWRSELPTE